MKNQNLNEQNSRQETESKNEIEYRSEYIYKQDIILKKNRKRESLNSFFRKRKIENFEEDRNKLSLQFHSFKLEEDSESNYEIHFDEGKNEHKLETKLDDTISNLIEELCEYLDIPNKIDFDFFIFSQTNNIFNLKFFLKFRVDKLFQKFEFKVLESIKMRVRSKERINLQNPKLFFQSDNKIHSKTQLVNILKKNCISHSKFVLEENFIFQFDKKIFYSLNHFVEDYVKDKNQFENFNNTQITDNFLFKKSKFPSIYSKDEKLNFYFNFKNSTFPVFHIKSIQEFYDFISLILNKIEKNPTIKNLNLVISEFAYFGIDEPKNFSNQIIEINFLKISFIGTNENSFDNFLRTLKFFKLKIYVNNFGVKFSKISKFKITQLNDLIRHFKQPVINKQMNLTLNLDSFQLKFEKIFCNSHLEKDINFISLKIKDEFFSISQNFANFIQNFLLNFNLNNFTKLKLQNLKIDSMTTLEVFFNFLKKIYNYSLSELILKNNKILTFQDDNKNYFFQLDKEKGLELVDSSLHKNYEKEEISKFPKFKNFFAFRIQNTNLLNLNPNNLIEFNFLNQDFKFNSNSVRAPFSKNFFPFDKFSKRGDDIKISLHSKISESYFTENFQLNKNISEISFNLPISIEQFILHLISDEETRDEREANSHGTLNTETEFILKIILYKKNLKNLKKLKFRNLCVNHTDNQIFNDLTLYQETLSIFTKNLNSFYLNSKGSKEINLNNFFKNFNSIKKLKIGNLFLSYNQKDFGKETYCVETFHLKFNQLKEMSNLNTNFFSMMCGQNLSFKRGKEKYLDTIHNYFYLINNHLQIRNLILSKETLNLIMEYLSERKDERLLISGLKNFIIHDTNQDDKVEILFKSSHSNLDSFFSNFLEKENTIKNFCIFESNLNLSLLNFEMPKSDFKFRIDYTTIINHIVYKTTLSNFVSILNAVENFSPSNSENELTLKHQILKNFEILGYLINLSKISQNEIFIFYKSEMEFNELIVLNEIGFRIKNGLENFKLNLFSEIKSFYKACDEVNLFNRERCNTNKIISMKSLFLLDHNKGTFSLQNSRNELLRINFIQEKNIKKVIEKICNDNENYI